MRQLISACLLSLAILGEARGGASNDPADLERTVSLMSKIGSSSNPSFSPDGKRIAFISNVTGIPQAWTVPTAGGWPELITAFDDPVSTLSWSPDGSWILLSLAPGGGMNVQLYLVRPDGSELKRLTEGGKETNRPGIWSRDGRWLTLASNRRNGSAIDPYIYDLGRGDMKIVGQNPGTAGLIDLTRDKKRALLSRLVGRGDNNLYLVDLARGKETLLTPHEPPGNFSGRFSFDGRSIHLSTNKGRDLSAFGKLSLSDAGRPGEIEVLASRSDGELDSFEVNPQGTLAALVWNVAGRSELELFDLRLQKSLSKPILPAEMAWGLEFSKDGRLLAMTLSGGTMPLDVWVLEVKSGSLRRVTWSPHPGVDLKKLVRPELHRFAAHDGLELSGWLYRPTSGHPPFPMVLSFHGGPEGQERPFFRSDYQALLARGIAVFAPNVRGSTGFGKKFVNLDNGELRFNGIKDIKSCVEFAVKLGAADPKRIGIMGGSYGGYMVVAGLTEYPELFAAGADLFGVVNFETFFKHTEPWMAAISKTEYGDPDTQADLLRRLSPIHKADRIIAPTIVLHGANDTNVPVVEAEQVVESLKARKVPVEYVLFPDEGHGFRKTPNRIRSTVSVTRWFERYLQNGGENAKAASRPE